MIQDLGRFGECLESSKDLKAAMDMPVFTLDQKTVVIKEICKRLKMTDLSERVLAMLGRQRRLNLIHPIRDELNILMLEKSEIVPIKVESACQLSGDEKKKIENKFERILGTDVRAAYHVDKELIGGVRVTSKGVTYDGTVLSQLNGLKEQLLGGN